MNYGRRLHLIAGLLFVGICLFADSNKQESAGGQKSGMLGLCSALDSESNSTGKHQKSNSQIQSVAKIKQEVAELERSRRHCVYSLVAGLRKCQNIFGLRHVRLSNRKPIRGPLPPDELSQKEEALIIAAGKLRAEACSDLLLNRITKRQEYDPQSGARINGLKPRHRFVYEALREIGKPACKAALKRIPVEVDQESRMLMTCLLWDCMGKATAREWLTNLKDRGIFTNKERSRIAEAISQLDTGRGPCSGF